MPESISIDLQSLTIAEVEEFEDMTGLPFDEAFGPGKPKAKPMRALVVISRRRTDPGFTWEQAGELVLNVNGEGPDPTKPAD